MADGRKNNGGHSTAGKAGRKSKIDEIKKIELMDKAMPSYDVIVALANKVKEGDMQAIKAWIEHRFGKAVETKELKHEYTGALPVWLNNEIDE